MRKIISFLIFFSFIFGISVSAAPPEFFGGVKDEYEYEEVIFITGVPIKMVGTMTISESASSTKKTVNYSVSKMVPENTSLDIELSRKATYTTEYTARGDKGQTTAATTAGKCTETITVGADRYTLIDMQFSKADVTDNRPASDFYSGNLKVKKTYRINTDDGRVVLEGTGTNTGYENFWGNTETQLMDYTISYTRKAVDIEQGQVGEEEDVEQPASTPAPRIEWDGIVQIHTSDSTTKSLAYSDSGASFASFNGGYIKVTGREMVTRYDYNLPQMEPANWGYTAIGDQSVAPNAVRRNVDAIELSRTMMPVLERLVVPKFRDTGGHWAQEYIEKLYSLDVFEDSTLFFVPDVPMTRLEFVKSIVKACDIRTTMDTKKTTAASRKQPKEQSVFVDMSPDDADYSYVKEAFNKGITKGENGDMFKPEQPLTRAQAITILMRALGYENKAPTPGYSTQFTDEDSIPDWALDSMYVAAEVGLLQGDGGGRVNPDTALTRAEASALIVRFLEFLEKDLKMDYRENIIYFD